MEASSERGPSTVPVCPVHLEHSTGPCVRCGSFLCARCPPLGLCEGCEPHIIRAAMRTVRIPSFLLIASGALGIGTMGVFLIQKGSALFSHSMRGIGAGPWDLLVPSVGLVLSLVLVRGGLQLRGLKGYRSAYLAAVIALFVYWPLAGAGLVVGGWAIWAIVDSNVRTAIRLHELREASARTA
jgi:hypothetical protein